MNADRDVKLPESAVPPAECQALPPTKELEAPTLPPQPDNKLTADTVSGSIGAATLIQGRAFGEYELLAEIARGGMGVVYKARQKRLNRTVAVKMILTGQLADQDEVRRFLTEAEAAAGLDHPGIVPVYESGEIDGQHFFSMGFVEGQSLAALLAAGPLPPQRSAELVAQVADAVDYAHERGVIHRDLKPGNILLDLEGHPRVTDFGLAKRVAGDSSLTRTGQALGTPSYMPPEQASGKLEAIGRAADVYALGAVLYAALTGRPPFQAATPLDTMLQVLEKEPVSPRQLNADVPRDLETIVLKCLQKDPRKRYATALDLADELRRFLAGQPIHARPVGQFERTWRWCKRNPVVASLATSSLVLVLMIAAVATGAYVRESRHRETIEGQNVQITQALAEETAAKNREAEQRQKAVRQTALAQQRQREAERNEDQANTNLYAAQMQLIQGAWRTPRSIGRIRGLLYGQVPVDGSRDYRGLEWYLWWRLANGEQFVSPEQPGQIVGVAIHPPSGLVISAAGREIRYWDPATGQPVGDRLLLDDVATALALSPDSRTLAVNSGDSLITLWDAVARTQQQTLAHQMGMILALAFAPDNETLAAGSGGRTVTLWKVSDQTSRVLQTPHTNAVTSLAFSPTGEVVAAGSWDNTVSVWNVAEGNQQNHLIGHGGPVRAVAFSADGSLLASGGNDGTVRLWDLHKNADCQVIESGAINALLFWPDGDRLVAGHDDGNITAWNVATRKPIGSLKGHAATVTALALDASTGKLVSGSTDGTVRQWNLESLVQPARLVSDSATVFRQMRFSQEVTALAFSPDATTLAAGSTTIHVEGPLKLPIPGALLPVRLWSVNSATVRAELPVAPGGVCSAAYSSDGSRLATAGHDNLVRLWDPAEGSLLAQWPGHSGNINALAFAPNDAQLSTASADGTVRVWPLPSGDDAQVFKCGSGVGCMAFSPNGKVLACGIANLQPVLGEIYLDRTKRAEIQLWEVRTGKLLKNIPGNFGAVFAVAFSSDGRWLASGGIDSVVRVWNVSTGEEAMSFLGHTAAVVGLAFAQHDRTLMSASRDATVRFWSTAARTETMTLETEAGAVTAFTVATNAQALAAACGEGPTMLWHAAREADVTAGIEKDAYNLVETIFDSLLLSSEVSARLRAREDLARSLRQAALRVADRLPTLPADDVNRRLRRRLTDSNIDYRPLVPAARDLVRREPSVPEFHETLGILLARSGELDEAFTLLLRADKMRPISPDGWDGTDVANLVTAHVRAGSLDRACELHRMVKQRGRPFRFTPDSKMGFMPDFRDIHQTSRATTELTAALERRADESAEKRAWDRAILDCRAVIEADPQHAGGHSKLARSLAALSDADPGNAQEAIEHALRANETTNWASWKYVEILAFAQAASGDRNSAGVTLETAVATAGPENQAELLRMLDEQGISRLLDDIPTARRVVATHDLKGHTAAVWCVAFSPNGSLLASGGDDNTVRLWDLATASPIASLAGHTAQVRGLAFTRDGGMLASASFDKTIRLWEPHTGQLQGIMNDTSLAYFPAFSLDGQMLVTGSAENTPRLWNVKQQKLAQLLPGHRDTAWAAAVSTSNNLIATGGKDSFVRLWKTDDGQFVRAIAASAGGVNCLAFSPDGELLAGAEGAGQQVSLWDPLGGELLRKLPRHIGTIYEVAFAPDGKTLATACGDGVVRLWDTTSMKLLATYDGGGPCLAFSPDGKTLASGGSDGHVRIWQVAHGK